MCCSRVPPMSHPLLILMLPPDRQARPGTPLAGRAVRAVGVVRRRSLTLAAAAPSQDLSNHCGRPLSSTDFPR